MKEGQERRLKIGGITAIVVVVVIVVGLMIASTRQSNNTKYMTTDQANNFLLRNWNPFWSQDGSHTVNGGLSLPDKDFHQSQIIKNGGMYYTIFDASISAALMSNSTWKGIGLNATTTIVFVNANYTIHGDVTSGVVVFVYSPPNAYYPGYQAFVFDLALFNMTASHQMGYTIKDV